MTDDTLSDDLVRLDAFLLSDAVGEDAMTLPELDGFLAGVIVSPDLIMPGEWMPKIWGGGGPVFAALDQAQSIIGLVMGHYNGLIKELDRGDYAPIYADDVDGSALWEIWACGFWRAVQLRPQAWRKFVEADEEEVRVAAFTLERLHLLADMPQSRLEPLSIDDELRQHAADIILDAVEALHRARVTQAAAALRTTPSETPKVGRNDPCPCGSGKKFKKCCLH